MALSGVFYKNVDARWRLQAEWSATQNVSANTSTVTTKLYWMALDGYGAVYSSASKSGTIIIDGTSTPFNGAGLASLTANQKKLIASTSKTVTHNADGQKSINLGGTFVAGITLNGNPIGTITLPTTAITLNTIPRASSVSSGQTWIAGSSIPVSIKRASSSFTHDVYWQVYNGSSWTNVKTATGVGASVTPTWTATELKSVFTLLAQTSSKASRIAIQTKNGATAIGGLVYSANGTVTAPTTSTISALNGSYGNAGGSTNYPHVLIDQATTVGITRNYSGFLHDVKLTLSTFTKTLSKIGTSGTLTLTSAEQTSLLALIPKALNIKGTLTITTYYEGVQVGAVRSSDITYYVNTANSKPTFSSTAISYKDENATTVALTGNNQLFINGYSKLALTLSTLATPLKSSTISKYTIKIGSITKDITATGTHSVGVISSSTTSATLTVTAYDSRGLSTEIIKTITVVPYTKPVLSFSAKRLNNYEASTTLVASATVSPILVGSANKNSIKEVKYATKLSTATAFGTYTNIAQTSYNATTGAYKGTNATISLDNTKAYTVEAYITDQLATTRVQYAVPVGKPIVFIDADYGTVGIGRLSSPTHALAVEGATVVDGSFDVNGAGGFLGNFYANSDLIVAKKSTLNGSLDVKGTTTLKGNFYANDANASNYLSRTLIRYGGQALTVGANEQDHVYIGFDARKGVAQRSGWVGYGADGATAFTVTNQIGNVAIEPSSSLTTFKGAINLSGQITNPAVTYPSLLNGWVNYSGAGGAFERAGYYKDKNGNVFINGLVKSGTQGTVIFTLPVGYRPVGTIMFTSNSNGAFARIDVFANGNVTATTAPSPGSWLSLGGLSFKAV